MSYSVGGVIKTSQFDDDLAGIVLTYEVLPDSAAAFEKAKTLVKTMYDSGAIGTLDYISVSISGHNEPGNVQQDSGAGSSLNIGINASTAAYYESAQAAKAQQLANES